MAKPGPAKKDIDDIKRKVKNWLSLRPGGCSSADAGNPDYHFVFSATHGDKPFIVGLHKKELVLQVVTQVQIAESDQEKLRTRFSSTIDNAKFLRELFRDLMEPGCAYNPKVSEEGNLESFQVISSLYPLDEPGLNRRDFEASIQAVVTATLRGVFYIQDVMGIEPKKPFPDTKDAKKIWDPMVS